MIQVEEQIDANPRHGILGFQTQALFVRHA